MVVIFIENRRELYGYKTEKNGLELNDADLLLELLQACAWAQPGPDQSNLDVYYNNAVSVLEQSAEWASNQHDKNWLSSNWMHYPWNDIMHNLIMFVLLS